MVPRLPGERYRKNALSLGHPLIMYEFWLSLVCAWSSHRLIPNRQTNVLCVYVSLNSLCVCILHLISGEKMKQMIWVLWLKLRLDMMGQILRWHTCLLRRSRMAVITSRWASFFYFLFVSFHLSVLQPCLDCWKCVLFLLILFCYCIYSTPPTITAQELKWGT